MSTISAGTSAGTALVNTGNTAGTLVFQTNGTTTALTLGTDQSATFVGAVTAPSFSGTSTTATNLAGGSNGTIPYQSASGTTQMLAVGTSGQYLKTNGVGAPSWATVSAGFTLGTPVDTTSGTAVTFTGIPSGTKQVIVNFSVFGIDNTNSVIIQLGTSSGIETTGYKSASAKISSSNSLIDSSSSFIINLGSATFTLNGSVTFTLENSTTNTFAASGVLATRDGDSIVFLVGGNKPLAGVLDRVKITSSSGTANFDSGEINIAYI